MLRSVLASRRSIGGPLASVGGGAAGPLVFDTFTGANGTILPGHVPDIDTVGGGWINYGGGLEIRNNSAVSITDLVAGYAGIETNAANVIITANLNLAIGTGNFVGVIARLSDVNNYWFIGTSNNGINSSFRIQEVAAGVATIRASQSNVVEVGNVYELVVVLSGAAIAAVLNGVEISYGSATHNQNETIHGVYNERFSRLLVQDVLINGL